MFYYPKVLFIAAFGLISFNFMTSICAQEVNNPGGELTVPWDEFKKLIHLDENLIIIPMDMYQKLLKQTGTEIKILPTIRNGNVILTRAQFKNLVDKMVAPTGPDITPPFDFLITKAVYSGKMTGQQSRFTAQFRVQVLKKNCYLKVPIFPQSIALEDVSTDGSQALVVSEGGYHKVIISEPGEHLITAAYSLRSSSGTAQQRIDLAVQRVPITQFHLVLPLTDLDVEIPQAQQISTVSTANETKVSAIISPGNSISVRWRKKVEATEKIPAKLYGEVHHLISIDDDVMKISSDILCNILHSELDAIRLILPAAVNILSVNGEGIGEWQELDREGKRILTIPFTYGKKGKTIISILTEVSLNESGMSNTFQGFSILDCIRETGFIGVELNTSAEVIINDTGNLEKIAVQKLPPLLYNKSVKPLLMAFKYLKHPYDLSLDVKKHNKIAVPVATINSANMVTLFTEDGKIVHRLIYQIRNSAKQFLEIQLPEKASVWSVFVSGEPVESSVNSMGKLLVPLIRSKTENNNLNSFPVEIVYCEVEENFATIGNKTSHLPAVDLLVSQLIWSVYLPNDYSYLYFNSSLEKEEIIRGINLFSGVKRNYNEEAMKELYRDRELAKNQSGVDKLKQAYSGEELRSSFRNVPLEEDQLASQMKAEIGFGGRLEDMAQAPQTAATGGAVSTGVLPIQIKIPTGGQVYRFARTIINPDDPLILNVTYTQRWTINSSKWFMLILVLIVIYLRRNTIKRIGQRLKSQAGTLEIFYHQHRNTLKKFVGSRMTLIILPGLFIILLFISKILSLLVFFLIWVVMAYQISVYLRERVKPEKKLKNPPATEK